MWISPRKIEPLDYLVAKNAAAATATAAIAANAYVSLFAAGCGFATFFFFFFVVATVDFAGAGVVNCSDSCTTGG